MAISSRIHLSPRRIENLEKLLSFDKVLLSALENEEVPTAQALVLQQAKGKYENIDMKAWIKRIGEEELSYRKLKKALMEKYGKKPAKQREPRLFDEIKGDNGDVSLRFWPVKLDPKAMTKEEAGKIKVMLERALELVKKIAG